MTAAWVGALSAAGAFTLSFLVLLVRVVVLLSGTSVAQQGTAELVEKLVHRVARLEQRDRLTNREAREDYRSEMRMQERGR